MTGQAAPGWYTADGDAPGTVRWWDGAQWTTDPVVQPPTQARLNIDYASWGQRVAAILLDSLVGFCLAIPFIGLPALLLLVNESAGIIGMMVGYLLLMCAGIYLIAWAQGTTGQSPGKRMMGIEVVRDHTGQFLGGGLGLARYFLSFLNSLPCYLGWLWPLWDNKNQTLVDKVLGTVVIRTTRSTKLFPLFPNGKPF